MANEKGSICVRSLVYALAGIFFTLKLYKDPVRGLCSAFMQRMIKRKDVLQHANQYNTVAGTGKAKCCTSSIFLGTMKIEAGPQLFA